MSKLAKIGFYAVRRGRKPGIFSTWDECEKQVNGYPGAKFKKFANKADAQAFVAGAPWETTPTLESLQTRRGKKRSKTEEVEDDSGYDVVYSDGACKGNGKRGSIAGVGVWWGKDDPRNIAERCPGDQTNNRAELIAIIRVLETTPKSKKPLMIKTDSKYSISCFERWLPHWRRNNFHTVEGDPVKNAGIIRYLSALLDARAKSGQKICLRYVRGHSGNRGNDGADAQANLGTRRPPVGERNWGQLEAELKSQIDVGNESIDAPLKVECYTLPDTPESRSKMRKISREPSYPQVFQSSEPAISVTMSSTASRSSSHHPEQMPVLPQLDGPSGSTKVEVSSTRKPARNKSPTSSPQRTHGAGVFIDVESPTKAHEKRRSQPSRLERSRSLALTLYPFLPEETSFMSYPNTPPKTRGEVDLDLTSEPLSTPSKVAGNEKAYYLPSASEWHARAIITKRNTPVREEIAPCMETLPVKKEDINLDDYEGCILDAEDLLEDLKD